MFPQKKENGWASCFSFKALASWSWTLSQSKQEMVFQIYFTVWQLDCARTMILLWRWILIRFPKDNDHFEEDSKTKWDSSYKLKTWDFIPKNLDLFWLSIQTVTFDGGHVWCQQMDWFAWTISADDGDKDGLRVFLTTLHVNNNTNKSSIIIIIVVNITMFFSLSPQRANILPISRIQNKLSSLSRLNC